MQLRVLSETDTLLVLGWDPVPGAIGFKFVHPSGRVSHTWDGTRTQVRFSKADGTYTVTPLMAGDTGYLEWPPVAPPPADMVVPSGTDHAALVAAISQARSLGKGLRLDGQYTYTGRLDMVGLRVEGTGTLTALNPDDANLGLGTGSILRGITVTCPSASSRSQAARAALVGVRGDNVLVENVTMVRSRQNGIWWDGASGTIRGCTIRDTFADGMHITHGSHDVLIESNTVENTGDDMIGIVSYEDGARWPRNARVTVRNNRLLGQTHGRGVGVVGGENIVVEDNLIRHSAGAAVYVACEGQYTTFSVDHVRVDRNRFENVDHKNIHNANVIAYCSRTGYHVDDVQGTGNVFDPAKPRVRITGITGAVTNVSVN